MPDDPLIASLLAALEAAPDDAPLRLHVAELLLRADRPADALDHAARVLVTAPADLAALRVAADAATAVGDAARADGYRRLLDALGGARTPPAPTTAGPGPAPAPAPTVDGFDWASAESEFAHLPVPVAGGEGEGDGSPYELADPGITLADVGGMVEVKRRLQLAFLAPMRNPEMRAMYGKSLRGGLLLYGPPGCGKTFIARATAGELGARFYSVGLSDVLDMYVGQSERNLHEVFELARRNAPCVLFLDEIDALGQKRSHLRHSGLRSTVNQLLAELDSVGDRNEGVFVLAATNHPWDVDTALRRPGRLDRTLLVLPPDEPARQAILEFHLRGRPTQGIDLAAVAKRTDGFSGADLAHVCETAAEYAMEDSIARGRPRPIDGDDVKRALKTVKPSTTAWFHTAKNHAMFANDGGAYDDLLDYLRARRML